MARLVSFRKSSINLFHNCVVNVHNSFVNFLVFVEFKVSPLSFSLAAVRYILVVWVMASEEASAKDLLTISSEHRLRSENLPFDIDVWYVFSQPPLTHFLSPLTSPLSQCFWRPLDYPIMVFILAIGTHQYNNSHFRPSLYHSRGRKL